MKRSILRSAVMMGCLLWAGSAPGDPITSGTAAHAWSHANAAPGLAALFDDLLPDLTRTDSALLMVVLLLAGCGAILGWRLHRRSAALARRMETEADLERRRSAILEDINGMRPLNEILEQIASLVELNLNGAPCWIDVENGASIGQCALEKRKRNALHQEIRAVSGPLLGTIYAAPNVGNEISANAREALAMAAWLATSAIETRRMYADLVHCSEFDLLTDVPNRASLEKRMDALIEEARMSDGCFGLIFFNLDGFRQVNDRYGHHIGDLFLQEATRRMKLQLGPEDMLARVSGDEFAALVRKVHSRADVEDITLRMERCFDEQFELQGHPLHGSVSEGMALFPEDGRTKDSLFSAADAGLYEAKRRRRQIHHDAAYLAFSATHPMGYK